ncbi:MAG: hypothetical protein OXC11_14480 [Rhodospirillales bacterium]|nr:hypothetical protein [Rhodospirillales bacterium]
MADFSDWLVRAAIGATVAAFAGLFLRVRSNEARLGLVEKAAQRQEQVEREFGVLKELTTRIDERLKHLPKHGDLQRIHDRISANGNKTHDTQTTIAGMAEEVRGLRSSVDRLHQIELKRGEK